MALLNHLKKTRYFFTIIVIISFIMLFFWMRQNKPKVSEPLAPAVTVAQVVRTSVSPKLSFPGILISLNIVNLRPRIEGQVIGIHFENGSIVKKDQLLFELDDSFLQTQLAQAQGMLMRDTANLRYSEAEVSRNKTLVQRNITSESKFEQAVATADSNRGTLQIDQATIEQYKIQIGYKKIFSPVDGKIGFRQIDIGNVVRTTDTNYLATIVQMDPIDVQFALPERYIFTLKNKNLEEISVDLKFITQQLYHQKGYIKSIDNQIDPASGTFLVRARFPNTDHTLVPGQYVTVEFSLEQTSNALVVPIEAVQVGQTSSYVYIYHPDTQTVHYQPVKSEILDDKTVEIKEGIQAGDTLLTSGHLKVKDNMRVRIVERDAGKAPVS